MVELLAVPCQYAFFAEGCSCEERAVAGLHLAEGFLEVGFGHEAAGEVAADDEVVDFLEEVFDAWVELVEVGDDGDAGFACPGGGEGCGGGVVAVDVEGAGVDDPIAVEVGGLEDESLVAAAEDGAFAAGVDEDEGLGAGAAGDCDELGLDAGVGEGFAVEGGGCVVAELADVAGGHAPVLTGDNGGCDLAAGEYGDGVVLDLGAAGRVVGEGDDGIGGVEPDADEVDLFGHRVTVIEFRRAILDARVVEARCCACARS